MPKKIGVILFCLVYLSSALPLYRGFRQPFNPDNSGTWKFYKDVAEHVYNSAPSDFGYYIYTTDQFGYSTRYSMNYMQRQYPDKTAYPYTKKQHTYLLIDDPGNHVSTNSKDWKQYDIKITSEPASVKQINKTYRIEHYILSKEEEEIASNPHLLQDLLFR